jgi:hypothetical protein
MDGNGTHRSNQQALHEFLPDPDASRLHDTRNLAQDLRIGMPVAVSGSAGSEDGNPFILCRSIGQDDHRAPSQLSVQPRDGTCGISIRAREQPGLGHATRNRVRIAGKQLRKGFTPGIPHSCMSRYEYRDHQRSVNARALARNTGLSR